MGSRELGVVPCVQATESAGCAYVAGQLVHGIQIPEDSVIPQRPHWNTQAANPSRETHTAAAILRELLQADYREKR